MPSETSLKPPRAHGASPGVRLRGLALWVLVLAAASTVVAVSLHRHSLPAAGGGDDPHCALCTLAHAGIFAPEPGSVDLVPPAPAIRPIFPTRDSLPGPRQWAVLATRAPPDASFC